MQPERTGRKTGAGIAGTVGIAGAALVVASELRVKRRERPLTDRWQTLPLVPGRTPMFGISFRPRQAEAFNLDPTEALLALLEYPFDVIRLAAYWNRIEPDHRHFDPSELDWQVDAAEAAGKQIIICVGPIKCFGYPEYFVPDHVLDTSLPEHSIVSASTHPSMLAASTAFAKRIVERYCHRDAVVAWQVEHEAVDPLGMEHSWRLSAPFVQAEVDEVKSADPSRPVVLNGFLPTSTPVRLTQWWRTRDQGDSLTVADRLADVVGVDFYPRHALVSIGPWSAYLDGAGRPWQQRRWRQLAAWQQRESPPSHSHHRGASRTVGSRHRPP